MHRDITCPDNLTDEAKAIWAKIAPHISYAPAGCAEILADFCWCLAELRDEREKLREEGVTVDSYRGGKAKNPRMQAVRELRQAVMRYANDFGLTSAAALRLVGMAADGDSPTADGAPIDDALLDGNWKPDETVH